MSDLVTLDLVQGIADVRLNRPDKYNALSRELFEAISETAEQLASIPELRAVVLSGNGRGFCAGLDMASFQGMSDAAEDSGGDAGGDNITPNSLAATGDRPENFFQRPAYIWKRVPVPVIAALHGVVYGGGAQIALGADIRIAAPDVRMSILEIKWGLIPDMSITQTLRDLVPIDVAKELAFTGRILNGPEARELGLVTHVDENPLERAMDLAREIASKSPDAIRADKQLFEETWHADPKTGLALEARLQGGLLGSPNQVEAIRANFEKRAPRFDDPK